MCVPYGWRGLFPASGRSAPWECLPAASISPVRNGGKNTRGFAPGPPGIKPLAKARSFFCVSAFCHGLFLAEVHQTRFGTAFFGETIFCWILLCTKIQQETLSQKKASKSGPVHGPREYVLSFRCVSHPKTERAASGLETRGPGVKPLVFFPPFLTGEMEAAGRHPPRGAAPRGG